MENTHLCETSDGTLNPDDHAIYVMRFVLISVCNRMGRPSGN